MPPETLSQPLNERLDYGHPLEFGYFLTPNADDPLPCSRQRACSTSSATT
jgi:hypothetical protein